MRKILFRGKDLETGEWRFGNLILTNKGKDASIGAQYPDLETSAFFTYDVDPETVCQSTEMYDGTKWDDLTSSEQSDESFECCGGDHYAGIRTAEIHWNGRLIFDGDIVKVSSSCACMAEKGIFIVKIMIEHDFAGFALVSDYKQNYETYPMCGCDQSHYKKIGNIFDNPDILNNHELD